MKSRILLLFSLMLSLWVVVLVRGAFVQIIPNSRLETLKRRQFEASIQIHARRGAIIDRNGKELAASIPSYSLYADPKMVKAPGFLARKLNKLLRTPLADTKKRLEMKNRRFVWVRRQIPEKQMQEIKAWNEPGLAFIEEPKRVYPNGGLFAQALGFVGTDGRGLEGLELQFDKQLRGGLKQVLVPRDARGRPLLSNGGLLNDLPDGADLELTIDAELQFVLEQELHSALAQNDAHSAMGLVLDAQTSEILAMATLPTFDLNEALKFSAAAKRNRVVTDAFEPGSTMKTFSIASALVNNKTKPNSRYDCENGRLKVGKYWITEADTNHRFRWLNTTEILAKSSNVGTTKIAFDLGAENLFHSLADFGFGQKTGIDLPGESRGILNPLPWRPHLLSNISFGHGLTATPLQVATAYAAIANGGFLRKPYLVRAIHSKDDTESKTMGPETLRQVLRPSEAATLRMMLTAATGDQATGLNARIPGYLVAGKTGTAQKVNAEKGGYSETYISSFAGFVPANDPRFVIFIAVDEPKKRYYGSEVAAPVFAKVAQYAVRRAGIAPILISEKNMIRTPQGARTPLELKVAEELKASDTQQDDKFPNLMGLSLREALTKLKPKTDSVQVKGHGWVVRTLPAAGDPWTARGRVTLVLENPD